MEVKRNGGKEKWRFVCRCAELFSFYVVSDVFLVVFDIQDVRAGCFLFLLAVITDMTSARHAVKRSDDPDSLALVVSTHSQVRNH